MKKICPACNQELMTPNRAWHNADAYNETCNVTTECCGKIITIQPVRTFRLSVYTGTETEDDWGVPSTK